MTKQANFLINIMGPTAVGKSSLAMLLAERYNLEIFSSDSRQVFQELTIGTAKPTSEQLSRIKHHFINSKSIVENYSAGQYEKEAISALNDYFQHNQIAILSGGTGLYIDAVLKGLDKFPDIPESLKLEINDEYKLHGLEYLIKELKETDANYFDKIDLKNPRRVIRAIQVIRTSGKPYSSFLNQKKSERNFTAINLILNLERDKLYHRINERVNEMHRNGLVEEVKNLIEFRNLPSLQTVGYQELFPYLDGDMNLENCLEEIKKNSRRYAKRQLTWLKKYDCPSFHPTETTEIIKFIKSKLPNTSQF